MEINSTPLQIQKESLQLLPESSELRGNLLSISVYSGKLTDKCIVEQSARINKAFPQLQPGFFDVLIDRLKNKGFTDSRLIDAVDNILDNSRFPVPMVSDVISWDKRIKLHTYSQIVELVNQNGPVVWDEYKAVKISGIARRVYASVIDIDKYNLETLK